MKFMTKILIAIVLLITSIRTNADIISGGGILPPPPILGLDYLTIHEGESFTWSFNSVDFAYEAPWPTENQLYMQWETRIDNVQSNGVLKISLYENNILESPFRESTHTFTGAQSEIWGGGQVTSNIAWTDKQGIIKFEAISGDADILYFTARTIVDGGYYTASIPEPNSVALLLVGAGIFYLRKKNFPTTIKPF